ncbi:hypothetical protein Pyn_08385 [Prunus yedoensis var. nudiflora]|uniref:Uncharacterized protein n=1 Tax=Prunus yedoensis var. nudiflora TaxID=2094558 RepID=A0A314Y696_PRUYE|nr:hypothetical protein Pyn_08385 [Prunus yedoensis var. nudiflora]
MNSVNLKRFGVNVVSSSNETDGSRENHVNGGAACYSHQESLRPHRRGQAKKPKNESSNRAVAPLNSRENGEVFEPSRDGTNGGGGYNGTPTTDRKTSPEGGSGPTNGKPDVGATQLSTIGGDE